MADSLADKYRDINLALKSVATVTTEGAPQPMPVVVSPTVVTQGRVGTLGTIPEVVIGNITGGQVVLKNIEFVPTSALRTGASTINADLPIQPAQELGGVSQSTAMPGDIQSQNNVQVPAHPEERMILYHRGMHHYITIDGADGKTALANSPDLEFVASFDRATAEKVAKTLADNPPGNSTNQINGAYLPINMLGTALMNTALIALAKRTNIINAQVEQGKLIPQPDWKDIWKFGSSLYYAKSFEDIGAVTPEIPKVVPLSEQVNITYPKNAVITVKQKGGSGIGSVPDQLYEGIMESGLLIQGVNYFRNLWMKDGDYTKPNGTWQYMPRDWSWVMPQQTVRGRNFGVLAKDEFKLIRHPASQLGLTEYIIENPDQQEGLNGYIRYLNESQPDVQFSVYFNSSPEAVNSVLSGNARPYEYEVSKSVTLPPPPPPGFSWNASGSLPGGSNLPSGVINLNSPRATTLMLGEEGQGQIQYVQNPILPVPEPQPDSGAYDDSYDDAEATGEVSVPTNNVTDALVGSEAGSAYDIFATQTWTG